MGKSLLTGYVILGFILMIIVSAPGPVEAQQLREPTWSVPDPVIDLAMSRDGGIIVISNGTHVKVFDSAGNLLWYWSPDTYIWITAVAVSADGAAVAAAYQLYPPGATYPSYYTVFWSDAESKSGDSYPSWRSVELGGPIGPDALALSGDGNHLVAVGTGPSVYYWNDTWSLSGLSVGYTWFRELGVDQLEYVDISFDGGIVVTGGYDSGAGYVILFFLNGCTSATPTVLSIKGAGFDGVGGLDLAEAPGSAYFAVGLNNQTGGYGSVFMFHVDSTYTSWESRFNNAQVADVAISDDASIVAAALNKPFGGGPDAIVVYHSATGYLVGLGPREPFYTPVSGPEPDAVFIGAVNYTSNIFKDISIDSAGNLVVAGTGDYLFAINTGAGELQWYYTNPESPAADWVAVSGNGQSVVSGGGQIDSLHYFILRKPLVGAELELPMKDGDGADILTSTAILAVATVTLLLMSIKKPR